MLQAQMNEQTPVETLEAAFAERYQMPGAVATGFGRGAIYLALEAIGVRGCQVLVPDFICQQVLNAVQLAGGIPVFYPVPLDLAIRPEEFRATIQPGMRAAILVHYFGMAQPAIRELVAICRGGGVTPIEDCALALLTPAEGGSCGTFADYATFSFTKSNWCYGGGMAVAREAAALGRMRRIRQEQFVRDDAFCEKYGQLSAIDFAANRPSLSHAMAEKGQQLQEEFAKADARFHAENFFDAPRPNVRMSANAGRRAMEILDSEPSNTARRRAILQTLLGGKSCIEIVGDGNAYLVFQLSEKARRSLERASGTGITVCRAWSTFQSQVPQTLHTEKIAVLEIHPDLEQEEIRAVSEWLANTGCT